MELCVLFRLGNQILINRGMNVSLKAILNPLHVSVVCLCIYVQIKHLPIDKVKNLNLPQSCTDQTPI